jgi:hypothetical protein
MKENNNIVNSVNNTFFIFIGMFIGFAATFFIKTAEEFTMVTWAVIIAVMSSLISIFIDFLIQPGEIFGFWFRVLKYMDNVKNPFRALVKPLGACMYCMNVWVTFASFIMCKGHFGMSWWLLIPTAAISHAALAIIERKVNS